MILLPAMVQAAQPWATAKSVAREISAVPLVVLQMISNPATLLEGLGALASRQGTLVVDGLPPGATVEVDGIVVRPTPTLESPLWVLPGTHTLRIIGPIGEELDRSDVTVGARQLVRVKFPRIESGESSLSGRDRLGIGLLAGSLALGGCFVTFGLLSDEQVEKAHRLSIGPDKQAWEDEVFTGQLWQVIANSCLVGAVGAIGFGGYLLLTDEEETNEPSITAKFGLFETGFGLKINL